MKSDKNIREGYKKTAVGVIPEEWGVKKLGDVSYKSFSGTTPRRNNDEYYLNGTIPWIKSGELNNWIIFDTEEKVTDKAINETSLRLIKPNSLVYALYGATAGLVSETKIEATINQAILAIYLKENYSKNYIKYQLFYNKDRFINKYTQGGQPNLNASIVRSYELPIPPLPEQEAIANCLTTWDKGIETLSTLIDAKREQKKGLMQQLLTGKKRLKGFVGEWEEKKLGDIADCLNNVRVPLNSSQRDKMRGNIPYCGANGIVDYVNDHVIDDDIILLAEDGGYFDEFQNRPIAYRMNGKCWVNNHAHILKAKEFFDQSFLFYSLVHKNIVPYIVGGTRAKLNQSALLQIKMIVPKTIEEQNAIAHILTIADQEISLLEKKLEAMKEEKKGVMQVLLTGKKRLIDS